MEFSEARAFTRYFADRLDEDDGIELPPRLAAHPDPGDLMPGTGGFRKAGWADARRGQGYLLPLEAR